MKKIILLIVSLFLLNSVLALDEYVTFNGNFNNGTTLYSDVYPSGIYSVYGTDVYPVIDNTQNQRQKVCTTYFREKRNRVCHTEIINNRRKRICEIQITQIPYEKCRYYRINPVTIGCLNPNGEYTNQLRLENFKVSLDFGSSWVEVPYSQYGNPSFSVNSPLMFKVDIPIVCSPTYEINKAIRIVQ